MGEFLLAEVERFACGLSEGGFDVVDSAAVDDFAVGAVYDDQFAFLLVVLVLDEGVDIGLLAVEKVLFETEDGDFGCGLGGVAPVLILGCDHQFYYNCKLRISMY